MKKILILMVLISTSMLSTRAMDKEFISKDQTVSTKYLVGLESSISLLKSEIKEIRDVDMSIKEGYEIARYLQVVDLHIMKAEELLNSIDNDMSLTMDNINKVKREIKAADVLLEELSNL